MAALLGDDLRHFMSLWLFPYLQQLMDHATD
jgi:hypothetical protein